MRLLARGSKTELGRSMIPRSLSRLPDIEDTVEHPAPAPPRCSQQPSAANLQGGSALKYGKGRWIAVLLHANRGDRKCRALLTTSRRCLRLRAESRADADNEIFAPSSRPLPIAPYGDRPYLHILELGQKYAGLHACNKPVVK
jgi:hypothetical protein